MLDEGAGARDALEIADAVDFLGADARRPRARPTPRTSICTCRSRAARRTRCRSWRTSSLRPTFPEAELKRAARGAADVAPRGQDDPEQLIAVRVPAARLRRRAPLRHAVDRHGGVAQGASRSPT